MEKKRYVVLSIHDNRNRSVHSSRQKSTFQTLAYCVYIEIRIRLTALIMVKLLDNCKARSLVFKLPI